MEEVWTRLQQLNSKRSGGSDCIPPIFYKLGCELLAEPLAHIINSSIVDAQVPVAFKNADVSAIPKTKPANI